MKTGTNVTLYLPKNDVERFKARCQSRGISMSQAILDLMRRELDGAEGQTPQAPVDPEALERDHLKLAKDVDGLEKWLKRRRVHAELEALAAKLDLKPDVSNLDEVAPKILEEWKRNLGNVAEDAHVYITLLRKVQRKKQIENQLEAIRSHRV